MGLIKGRLGGNRIIVLSVPDLFKYAFTYTRPACTSPSTATIQRDNNNYSVGGFLADSMYERGAFCDYCIIYLMGGSRSFNCQINRSFYN